MILCSTNSTGFYLLKEKTIKLSYYEQYVKKNKYIFITLIFSVINNIY